MPKICYTPKNFAPETLGCRQQLGTLSRYWGKVTDYLKNVNGEQES